MKAFIIGAGFTKAVFPDAPLNAGLLQALAGKSHDSPSVTLRDRYGTQDIEIALTRLDTDIASSQHAPEQLGSLRELRGRIENELASYFSSFRVSEDMISGSPWLVDFIDGALSSDDVAISLNYDCVLEGALDCGGKWSPNGGYGSLRNPLVTDDRAPKSPVTVLKIHGSSNFVIAPYADNPAARAVNFEFDERCFPRSAKNTHFGYGAGTGRTYVIAPSYVKIPTVEISYLMLDALTALTKAKDLVIIGSALRPEDGFLTVLVTIFLRQPSWRDRKIIVVDPAAESICMALKRYWGVEVSSQILPIEGQLQTSLSHLMEAIGD